MWCHGPVVRREMVSCSCCQKEKEVSCSYWQGENDVMLLLLREIWAHAPADRRRRWCQAPVFRRMMISCSCCQEDKVMLSGKGSVMLLLSRGEGGIMLLLAGREGGLMILLSCGKMVSCYY